MVISIHAPVKGATCPLGLAANQVRNFNPRSREGSDGWPRAACPSVRISIHAPVKGATPPDGVWFPGRPYFNPRSREGSDPRSATGV